MHLSIVFLDFTAFLSSLAALVIIAKGWQNRYTRDIKLVLFSLLLFYVFYSVCFILEWSGITNAFESYEDLLGALVPMMWAFIFYALFQDVASRDLKESEELLQVEKDHLETITRNIGAGLVIISKDYKILWENKVFSQISGGIQGENCFKTIFQLDTVCPGCKLSEIFESGKNQLSHEQQGLDASGNRIWFEIIATPIKDRDGNITAALELVVPITQRKLAEEEKEKLEKQLRFSQKMEAIGTLAGGIAHDFNNILAAILGYTSLAQMDLEDADKVKEDLDQIYKGAIRAKELIQQILTLSRETEQQKQPLEIGMVIKEALKLLRSSLPTSIDIKHKIISREKVFSDATQIHQVIMNLCTNAYHAMRDSGGILTVSLTDAVITKEIYIPKIEIPPGKYVVLKVEDTGDGMSDNVMERIFDPYFTTKEVGEGTGLGLSVVHGIVKGNKGYISIYSEVGVGTCFMIYLPVFEGETVTESISIITPPVPGGCEKILFVDDEAPIANLAKQGLEKYGYRVTTCSNGKDALHEFEKNVNDYDLIITDMTMPQMTGIELVEHVRKLKPGFPIILCSGYSDLIRKKQIENLNLSYLEKPVEMKELVRVVRTIFDQ